MTPAQYLDGLSDLLVGIDTQDIRQAVALVRKAGQVFFIGNGGSAAIASHLAQDAWKRAGLRAYAFNDVASVTAVSNDLGYEHVFALPISRFAHAGDVLVAISSSGQSPNILLAVETALEIGCSVVALSGFSLDNLLRRMGGAVHFHVPSRSYGHVEITHLAIGHCILDTLVGEGTR